MAAELRPSADDRATATASASVRRRGVDGASGSRVPTGEVEAALSSCRIGPTAEVAEQVLKSRTCYSRPKSAVRFFVWAGRSVKHTAYAWNLLVDILGKAAMFEPMWDAIRSMTSKAMTASLRFPRAQ